MKFAYADPPYIGQAARHYAAHPDYAGEVDHAELIGRLDRDYEAWALSLSTPTLRTILALCPDDDPRGPVRVGAWVKPFAVFRPGVNPAYAWEPLIWRGGRKRPRGDSKIRDYVSSPCVMNQKVHGTKPDAFCWWMFDLLGAEPGDEFHDLFPGSGAVARAWESYRRAKEGFPLFAQAIDGPAGPWEARGGPGEGR